MQDRISKWTETQAAFFWVFGLSAVIKLLTLLPDPAINRDGVLYISAARLFSDGCFREALAMYPAPAYPLLIATVHAVIPGWIAAARFISLSASILVLIPLYLLARRLFNREAAFWACLAFAVLPFTNEAAIAVIRGPSFLFLFAWAVYFSVRAVGSPRLRFFLWAGLLSWVSVAFRMESVVLLPFGLLFFGGLVFFSAGEGRRSFMTGLLCWALICVLPLVFFFILPGDRGPSFLRIDYVLHKFRQIFNGDFLATYHQIYDHLKNLEQASQWPSGKENLAEIARRFMPLLYALGLLHAFVKVFFPPFVLPFFGAIRRPFGRARLFVLLLAAVYLLMIYYRLIAEDFIQSRFLLAPAFLLFPWVGAGMARFFRRMMHTSRPGPFAVILVTLFFLLPLYRIALHSLRQDRVVITAGRWISSRPDLYSSLMITNDARIPFYANRRDYAMWFSPSHDYALMERDGALKGARLLAIRTSIRKKAKIPSFRFCQRIKEFTGNENVVVIYRYKEPQKSEGHH